MKAQTLLAHYPDGTQFSRVPARLSWTDDDRLVLERIDESGAAVESYFDTPVSSVRVTGGLTTPKFTVAGRGYRVDFNESARIQAMLSGVFGGLTDNDISRAASIRVLAEGTTVSGVGQWVTALAAAGASTSYWTMGKIVGVSVAAVAALVVLLFVALVIPMIAIPFLSNGGAFG